MTVLQWTYTTERNSTKPYQCYAKPTSRNGDPMEIQTQPKAPPKVKKPRRAERPKVIPESQNGDGMLLEPEFDEERFLDYLSVLSIDFLVKNYPEGRLRTLCTSISETLDRCAKRLQHLEQMRHALVCTHCQKPLPGGRFAGEIVIRDDITGELQALRACSEPCYREVSRIANDRRAKHQGSIRGTIAM